MPPKVAVVILNYNGRHYLETFLPSVLKHSPSTDDYLVEIVVADNASTDDSIEFLEQHYPSITILKLSKNTGYAGGYNNALQQVISDLYVLLNSDIEVTPSWIEPVFYLMRSNKMIAASQPKILDYKQKDTFEHAGASGGWMDEFGYPFCRGRIFSTLEKDTGQYDDTTEIFWATGAALFIRANLFHKIGRFDADYFAHMEEIDLCWRLKRAGYKIMVCPKSKIYHVGGGTLTVENPFKTYLNFRNNIITLLKNCNGWKLYWLIPARLILDGLAGVLFLKEGKYKNIWAIVKAHWYVFAHFFTIIGKRMDAQQKADEMYINPPSMKGSLHGSIVGRYYILGKKTFNKLMN